MRHRNLYSLYKVKRKGKKPIYHFRIWSKDGRKRISHTTGCTSKERASAYAHAYALATFLEREKVISLGEFEIFQVPQRQLLFRDYAKNWWKWDKCPYVLARRHRGTKNHPGIKRSYTEQARRRTELYLIPYLGDEELRSITPRKIEWFQGKLKKEHGLSPKTINNIRSLLSIMFNEAKKEGLITTNPVSLTLPMIVDAPQPAILTNEEAADLLNINNLKKYWNDNITYYSVNLLAATTGMRIGEIRALKISDMEGDELYVSKNLSKYGMTTTKTSEKRRIPLSPELKKILIYNYSMHSSKTDFIFSCNGNGPIAESGARDALKAALEKKGISNSQRKERGITFHKWRDFFTTNCVAANISSVKIKKVTGHKSDNMLEHYTNLRTGDSNEILELQKEIVKHFEV